MPLWHKGITLLFDRTPIHQTDIELNHSIGAKLNPTLANKRPNLTSQ